MTRACPYFPVFIMIGHLSCESLLALCVCVHVCVCVCCGQEQYYTGHLTAALLPSSLRDWKSFLFQLHPQLCEMKCHPVWWYWAFWKLSWVTVLQLITVKINRIFDNIPDANLPLKYVMSAVWGKSPNSNPVMTCSSLTSTCCLTEVWVSVSGSRCECMLVISHTEAVLMYQSGKGSLIVLDFWWGSLMGKCRSFTNVCARQQPDASGKPAQNIRPNSRIKYLMVLLKLVRVL